MAAEVERIYGPYVKTAPAAPRQPDSRWIQVPDQAWSESPTHDNRYLRSIRAP
jgi:hypothetical protein